MTQEDLVAELQNEFTQSGVEFLRITSNKSSALFEFIKPHLNDVDNNDTHPDNIRAYIKVNESELSSLEGAYSFNFVLNSLLDKGYNGAVMWCISKMYDVCELI